MRRTRKTDHRTPGPLKKLDLRRETLRRLDTLSDADLRQAIGGVARGDTKQPSIMPTSKNEGC